jgi:uncharacterized protein (TIGR02284 family)
MNKQEEIKKSLKQIVEINSDSYKGYEKAASSLENTEHQTLFNRLAQQRKLFIEQIKGDARDNGITVEDNGSVAGFFHRNWLATKAVFSFDKIESVVESSIEGEKAAIETYAGVLKDENLPLYVKTRLNVQMGLIKVAKEQLKGILMHEA